MASALLAVLPLAHRGFLKHADMLSPAVIFTASGFQSVKALTGPPDHERHELQ
jgi:hypothetical protein